MIPWTIRPYDAARDGEAAYALWQAALGDLWPTNKERFHSILVGYKNYATGDHFVAERGGRMLGLVATQTKREDTDVNRRGSIPLIMVTPDARRQGIGTVLLEMALEHLKQNKVRSVQLGAGGHCYFWQGIPECLSEALAFFQSHQWESYETSHDLVRDLRDYTTPPELQERVATQNISLRIPSTGAECDAVLTFEQLHFPGWADYFHEEILSSKGSSNVLAAWDAEGHVIGTLLLFTANSGDSHAKLWKPILGEDMGGLGTVGVAEAWRERGVGTALTARASEILKERGVRNSHIGWTWLLDFYGRLGYKPWRSYAMFRQTFEPAQAD